MSKTTIIDLSKLSEDMNMSTLDNRDIFKMNSTKRSLYTKYDFQGLPVPRVNEILSACIGKDHIVNWAAKLGYDEYISTKSKALKCGEFVHDKIENFVLTGEDKYVQIYSQEVKATTLQAYDNFKKWYYDTIDSGLILNPLYTEMKTTNPWYGGTIDCIMNISNPKVGISDTFIIDYKTSKKISMEYILQTYAYMWSWNWNKKFIDNSLPEITGIGIIRVDKEKQAYNTIFLTIRNNMDLLLKLDYDLASLINWFYCQQEAEYILKMSRVYKEYN